MRVGVETREIVRTQAFLSRQQLDDATDPVGRFPVVREVVGIVEQALTGRQVAGFAIAVEILGVGEDDVAAAERTVVEVLCEGMLV